MALTPTSRERECGVAGEPIASTALNLAGRCERISTELQSMRPKLGHKSTTAEYSAIASELSHLSTTLSELHEAMAADIEQYTESFKQDLQEIISELNLIVDEVADCCSQLQRVDNVDNGAVAWLFKKGKAQRLINHLRALKATLIVMRTVLWHGKSYGTQKSVSR